MNATWVEQLRESVDRLSPYATKCDDETSLSLVRKLEDAAEQVALSWSGSPLGYHSRVYYHNFQVPPPGAHFSMEWGFQHAMSNPTRGEWKEYSHSDVIARIELLAGDPNISGIVTDAKEAASAFEDQKSEIASILSSFLAFVPDAYIESLKEELDNETVLTEHAAQLAQIRTGQMATRDQRVNPQIQSAPHQDVIARTVSLRAAFSSCQKISRLADRAARHIDRLTSAPKSLGAQIGTKVFIGHGRSLLWRELKDFIQDRIGLPYDEFNRIPVAGVANIERLVKMLDDAIIAFLVLTAEDELADESYSARQNVVHEAGLFQGRLGFSRAIVMIEEGCNEFSNIQGLGQIRFPLGNVSASFEEVRRVLEREGLVDR